MNRSQYVAFSLDEGETIAKNKILSLNGYILDQDFNKKVKLFGLIELKDLDAESISKVALKILKDRNVKNDCIVGGASDGASTMLGKNAGVMARLKDYFELMVINHCGAHKVNLTVQSSVSNNKTYKKLKKHF